MTASARHYARLGAVQFLYAWDCSRESIGSDDDQILLDFSVVKFSDLAHFRRLTNALPEKVAQLDRAIEPAIDRPLNHVDPVELAILRLGAYELLYEPDIPPRVVIDECIELAKMLSHSESYKFINGVLDKVAFGNDSALTGATTTERSSRGNSDELDSGEFDIIRRFFSFSYPDREDVIQGVGDDAAVLGIPASEKLVVTTDTLVEGVHFPSGAFAGDIGYKSLAVSLSDLAAMGARPAFATLNISLPQVDEVWLEEFRNGLRELATEFNVALVGGDTVKGPLSITVTLFGTVSNDTWLSRSGAQPGDEIFVTGSIGDAALGLAIERGSLSANEEQTEFLCSRLSRPSPRIEVGMALCGIATAAIDISDGFIADLNHLLNASQVGAQIDQTKVPLSKHLKSVLPKQRWHLALTQGDDYELCFTLPSMQTRELRKLASSLPVPITHIGTITKESGLTVLDGEGNEAQFQSEGYVHF